MCIFLLCPSTPPEKAHATGASGAGMNKLLEYQGMPNAFQVNLLGACPADPLCCCCGFFGAGLGCTACWARKSTLEAFGNGIDDYTCCQNYIPACCCCGGQDSCKGNMCAMCCEGLCCPILSLSIARIYVMDIKQIHPDPVDYQIIACSNCLQIISCIIHIIAIFVEQLREAARIIDCIADLFTLSVAGCMAAQLNVEMNYWASQGTTGMTNVGMGPGQPPVAVAVAQPAVAVAQPVKY